jgi:3-oxoacyl-[acyl-carrier protein] reductase
MVVTPEGSGKRRVAIVTGGSRGIGKAIVHRLARIDYAVVVNYVHDQLTADSTVEAVLDAAGAAVAVRADVADELDVERLFATTADAFGAIDVVVHAVHGNLAAAPVGEIALADLDAMLRTTARAALVVNREAARHLRPGGAIVNLLGSVSSSTLPMYGTYAMIAAAINALCRTLALELRDRNITVNAVSLDVQAPCAPDKVVDAIASLLTDAGHGITSQVIQLGHLPPSADCPSEHWCG